MKKTIIILASIMFITSCQSSDNVHLVTIENRYSISLPSFLLKSSTTLNEDASLQYINTWKEFYVIVIDEPKSELHNVLVDNNLTDKYSNDIEGYSNLVLDSFEQSISTFHKSDIIDTLINNMNARVLSINGRVEGIDVFYRIALVQGEERLYQVMVWTLSSKENEHKEKMNKILYSLKEL